MYQIHSVTRSEWAECDTQGYFTRKWPSVLLEEGNDTLCFKRELSPWTVKNYCQGEKMCHVLSPDGAVCLAVLRLSNYQITRTREAANHPAWRVYQEFT